MNVIGHTDVKENDFKDTHSLLTFSEGASHAEDEENDSNDTPAYDDDAHKAVLCTHSNFL